MAKPFTLPKDGEQMDAAYMKAEFERNGWTKEEVIGIIRMNYASSSSQYEWMFYQCTSLVRVSLRGVKYDISFSNSPLISLESLQYLITNAANTSPITVTVHADVYAKIQDETQTEWHALIASAQEKNITFATA